MYYVHRTCRNTRRRQQEQHQKMEMFRFDENRLFINLATGKMRPFSASQKTTTQTSGKTETRFKHPIFCDAHSFYLSIFPFSPAAPHIEPGGGGGAWGSLSFLPNQYEIHMLGKQAVICLFLTPSDEFRVPHSQQALCVCAHSHFTLEIRAVR